MRLVLASLLFLVGCGSNAVITVMPEHVDTSDKELFEYLEEFYQYNEPMVPLVRRMIKEIKFGELRSEDKPLTAGTCYSYVYKTSTGFRGVFYSNYIIIDTSTWNSISEVQKKFLVWHESYHCAVGLGHQGGEDQIMNPFILPTSMIITNWDTMLSNAFKPDHPRIFDMPTEDLNLDTTTTTEPELTVID